MKESFEASGRHKRFDYLWSQNGLRMSQISMFQLTVATRPQMACAAVHQCHPWISNADTHSTNGGFITE